MTAKFGLTPTVTLDLAINPDFAQVEADATVNTANQRFPIFFDEKRPFFLEGKDIFTTLISAVHTRTIIDPDIAAKLTGKRGRNTFGILPAPEPDAMPPDAMEAACVGFTRLMEWLWQDGMKNSEGLQIRAAILCWVFLSQLRPLTMTQMAAGFGKKKQSLGRWVDDYKRQPDFPRIAHMKH